MINESRNMLSETAMASTLSAASNKISETAKAIAFSGCGSTKTIEIYVTPDVFMNPLISPEGKLQFTTFDGEIKTIKSEDLPQSISLSVNGPVESVYTVRVEKSCT